MGRRAPRAAFWALAFLGLLVLVSLAPFAQAAPSYTLKGQARTFTGTLSPGATIDLISGATHAVYTTTVTTGTSGLFSFTSTNTNGALAPGWWGLWVPDQSNVSLQTCRPCAVLDANPHPTYYYLTASDLTSSSFSVTVRGLQQYPFTASLHGTANYGPVTISVRAPWLGNMTLENWTSTAGGGFTMPVPVGTWLFQAVYAGSPNLYATSSLSIGSGTNNSWNPSLSSWVVSGFVDQASTGAPVPYGGNVTAVDTTNGAIFSSFFAPGGFYQFGSYSNAAFGGSGAATFNVFVDPTGFSTAYFSVSVSSGTIVSHDVAVTPVPSQGTYTTTLNLSTLNVTRGTGGLAVSTTATLLNDSTFSELPNATIGSLWAQLGLDFNAGSLTFSSTSFPAVMNWINSTGPFFPAAQAGFTVNGTGFTASTTSYGFANSTSCSGSCGVGSGAYISMVWNQAFGLSGRIPVNAAAYTIAFGFKHPLVTNERYNYTVVLPAGFILSAGTTPPTDTQLFPAGPGGTWTSFTLSSLSSDPSAPSGTGSFTIVRAGGVQANVNVTSSSFTFSSANVLNSVRGQYNILLGVGENATYSGLNSTYPAGTNGTRYVWNFGDGTPVVSSGLPTENHTFTHFGVYTGSLTVTSSGGLSNTVDFNSTIATGPATANITSNATAGQTFRAGTTRYLVVNWSATLQFNASGSSSALYPGASGKGIVSAATWTVSAHSFSSSANYSLATGACPCSNFTFQFLGNGYYLSTGTVGSSAVPFPSPGFGWEYNVSVTVWDAAGYSDVAWIDVLVLDHQKPVPAVTPLNAKGQPIGNGSVVEGANQTAQVIFSAANSSDPNNGSITWYNWTISNPANPTFVPIYLNQSAGPGFAMPYRPSYWLPPQVKPYSVNLTVTDRAHNVGTIIVSVTVTVDASLRPIMAANNLTLPTTSFVEGTSYTLTVNVTAGGGALSTGVNVQVRFYLLPPSGTGNPILIGGSPGNVKFYNETNGTRAATPFATGTIPSLAHNASVLALTTWTPGRTGNWVLYANATASNEFYGDYINGPNVVSRSISIQVSLGTQIAEYGAIAAVVVIVIVALIFFYRRRVRRPVTGTGRTTARSGLERGSRRATDDEDDEDT